MSNIFHVDHKFIAIGALTATSAVAIFSTWKYLSMRKKQLQDNVYETETYLNNFLLFHYGNKQQLSDPWAGQIDEKYLFMPKKLADLCMKHGKKNGRALEVGCSVGRSTFELARHFDKVLGIDYSHLFVDTCQILKEKGSLLYSSLLEGELNELCNAVVDPSIDRKRTEFQHGDACCLPLNIGQFDCVLAANILCRLKTPKNFLDRLTQLVTPSGIVVLASPYAFFTTFTPRENWIGGFKTANGVDYSGSDGVRDRLSSNFDLVEDTDMPMLMRESRRKYYLAFCHVQVWRRK